MRLVLSGKVDPDVAGGLRHHGARGVVGARSARAARARPTGCRLSKDQPLPWSDIDLAFVVDDSVAAFDIETTMREAAGDLLVDLRLFDVFRGPSVPKGSRSLACRAAFAVDERTLTDGEVAAVRKQIVDAVRVATVRRSGLNVPPCRFLSTAKLKPAPPLSICWVREPDPQHPGGLAPGPRMLVAPHPPIAHAHASSCIMQAWPSYRVGIVGASGYTGVELLRLWPNIPTSTSSLPPATRRREHPPPRSTRAWRPRIPISCSLASTRRLDGLDLVFLALPHGEHPRRWCPSSSASVARIVDLAADFRLSDPALYPQWYGEAHTPPELLADVRVRPARALPPRDRGRRRRRRAGLLPTAAALALAPLVRAGVIEPTARSSTPRAGVSGAGRAPKANTRSAPSTRTSPPTACSTTATRPRSSRPPAAPGALHAAPGADEPGHPRHLLRPADGGDVDRDAARRLRAGLRRRAVRRRAASVAVDQGDARLQHGPPHRARYDDRTGWVVALRRHRQPRQGRLRAGDPVRQLALGLPEATGCPSSGCTREQRGRREGGDPRRGAAVHPAVLRAARSS